MAWLMTMSFLLIALCRLVTWLMCPGWGFLLKIMVGGGNLMNRIERKLREFAVINLKKLKNLEGLLTVLVMTIKFPIPIPNPRNFSHRSEKIAQFKRNPHFLACKFKDSFNIDKKKRSSWICRKLQRLKAFCVIKFKQKPLEKLWLDQWSFHP
jgi:hypothetical protein